MVKAKADKKMQKGKYVPSDADTEKDSVLQKQSRRKKRVQFSIALVFWAILLLFSPVYIPLIYNAVTLSSDSIIQPNKIADFTNKSCVFLPPKNRTVIIRLDDVQYPAYFNATKNITSMLLENNLSVVFGVIPSQLSKNNALRPFLLESISTGKVEVAQHGYDHTSNEFRDLSVAEAENLTRLGKNIINTVLKIEPVTFIPPYNEYNSRLPGVLANEGFYVLSAREDEYKYSNDVFIAGLNAQTQDYGFESNADNGPSDVPVATIVQKCNASLEEKNICVIMVHPQEFLGTDKSFVNPLKYERMKSIIAGIKSLNATSATFRDFVYCK